MKKVNRILFTAILISFSGYLQGQRLIKNIDPKVSYEHIKWVTANEDFIFFTANDSVHGEELWRSGGTESSTTLLKDINPGINSAWNDFQGREFIVFANKVYFNANDGVNGDELWVSAGTTNTTLMLKDINTGSSSSTPRNFFIFNNQLFFTALTSVGTELWKTDGTEAGTVLVKNINTKTASASSNPRFFTLYNYQLFFKAEDGTTGSQIWKTNGTDTGTKRVSNGNPGNANGLSVQDLMSAGSYMYFTGNNGSGDLELYRSDGTETGTVLVKDINPSGSSRPSIFKYFKGKVFFKANDGSHGEELWMSDGSESGTTLVKDIYTGTTGGASQLYSYGYYKSELYFTARGTGENSEIWKTDGTSNGTVKVTTLNANGNSNPNGYFVHANTLYFTAIYGVDGSNAYELFRTDGSSGGTSLIYNINKQANGDAGIQYLTPFNDKLVFMARNQDYGQELWALDNVLTQSTVEATVCDSFTLNNKTYKFSGTYLQYLTNGFGYDSLININLFVYGKPTVTQAADSLVCVWNNANYQWQLNGSDISGATQQKYRPTVNGNYTVRVQFLIKKGTSCTKTSDAFNLQNVGVANPGKARINIYPNPAQNYLIIETSQLVDRIIIAGMDGREVISARHVNTGNSIQLDHLKPGLYTVQFLVNGVTSTQKLLVQ